MLRTEVEKKKAWRNFEIKSLKFVLQTHEGKESRQDKRETRGDGKIDAETIVTDKVNQEH